MPLHDILKSTLFLQDFPDSQQTGFAVQIPGQPFPMLTQAEHPISGTPCWSLHPCATQDALGELIKADETFTGSPTRMLELWLLLVGNIINLNH